MLGPSLLSSCYLLNFSENNHVGQNFDFFMLYTRLFAGHTTSLEEKLLGFVGLLNSDSEVHGVTCFHSAQFSNELEKLYVQFES